MNILKAMSIAALIGLAAEADAQEQAPIGRADIKLESDRMTPEALWAMGRIGSMDVSPEGKIVAYSVTYYSVEQNRSHTVICTINTDGSDLKQLTTSDKSESDPAFIAGGKRIAYLSSGQLWSMDTDGGDRKQLTHGEDEVEGFQFSPDGRQVILIREVAANPSIQPKEPDLPKATGLVIDDMNYKHWDQYVTTIPHIFLASFDGEKVSEEKDLLEGEPYECPMLPFGGTEEFCWSPDSKLIAYTCRKKTGVAYAVSTDSDIYLYDTETGETTNVCKPADYVEPEIDSTTSMQRQAKNQSETDINAGYDQDPQFSPDGSMLAWKSMERDGYESDRTRLCVLNLATGEKSYVTESFESGVDEFVWADNQRLFFTGVWMARIMVYSTDLKGNVKPVTTGDYDYADLHLMPDGKGLLVKRHSISAPDDIYLIGKGVTQLTHENDHILSQLALGEVKERWVETTDGKRELCWVVYPSHFNPSRRYPTLLYCEGGPQEPVSQFWSYRWNFQIMAANDYIIIAPNRRGLPGFGMEWLEEISGDYSGQCMQDYLAAIDDISREPYVDKDRLGCIGASFGGYSVYWLAGNHEGRFKAFIAHDGIFNTQQQYFETEEMWFPNWDMGGSPDRVGEGKAFKESPHLYVDKWDTPILCIHSEKDYRILSSQGQSAFSAARMHGIPAQLLLYPDENHWVLKPQNGVLWQRTFFRWLDRWLK
ncbi:MAG: S9 family peptidase [Prevotellaceae bacterium]|nr:S9 family peptidase [Prevotellaceae bacterium]